MLAKNSMMFYHVAGVDFTGMKLDDNKRKLIKRILAGLLAVVVLCCGIAFSYYLSKGYGEAAVPSKTPDNSAFVDSSVELPDESETPSEFVVVAAFIAIEGAAIAIIVYVLIRKKV